MNIVKPKPLVTKQKEPLAVKPVVKQLEQNYPYNGSWHGTYTFKVAGITMTVAGLLTGCGLMQIAGIYRYLETNKHNKEEFMNAFIPLAKKHNCGTIIATLGDTYVTLFPKIEELGFKQLAKYSNLMHAQPYNQRLYILTIP